MQCSRTPGPGGVNEIILMNIYTRLIFGICDGGGLQVRFGTLTFVLWSLRVYNIDSMDEMCRKKNWP